MKPLSVCQSITHVLSTAAASSRIVAAVLLFFSLKLSHCLFQMAKKRCCFCEADIGTKLFPLSFCENEKNRKFVAHVYQKPANRPIEYQGVTVA